MPPLLFTHRTILMIRNIQINNFVHSFVFNILYTFLNSLPFIKRTVTALPSPPLQFIV